MQKWLMKSEPGEFSIDDLKASHKQTNMWDGVRNYQARNFIRDGMEKGDLAFFYHSNCDEPGIVGIMEVVKEAYPDPTALDPDDKHFDSKSDPDEPRWFAVDLKFKRKLGRTIGLAELKRHERLAEMQLLKRGNRLSVLPIGESEWDFIVALE
ncbi:MAG: EVE domain-containing protein [Gammaproteobacteria bacterium]|jgi:predicted RNA-binding protein with PUA-like domain|nr:EVE domain-containing protein [Gammaproteobacteria bacterium]